MTYNLTSRDLGPLGEATLEAWCAQVGIVSNLVKRDKTGWDNLLEFPLQEPSGMVSLDQLPAPVQARVQVKSSDANESRITIKLSNWVRLVKDPTPAFILILEFEGRKECQTAYLDSAEKLPLRGRRFGVMGSRQGFSPIRTPVTSPWWPVWSDCGPKRPRQPSSGHRHARANEYGACRTSA